MKTTNLKTISLPQKGEPFVWRGFHFTVECAVNAFVAVSKDAKPLPPTMWVRLRDNGVLYETTLAGNRTYWTTPKQIAGAYVRQ
jgi:hypothetical protein